MLTRQEELVQAARKEYPEWEEAQCHYIDGAHYADVHPHWISVQDELPIDYEPVLAVVGGNHFAFVGICLNKTTWYCEIQNKAIEIVGVTHWIHLPQPPVVEVRTIYDVMADESYAIATSNEEGGEE